ncbi:hypothetical protein [Roseomonas elaeocarpi]|uniref:Uncharacterized protein n=1 Tax=Roseomonas elaeocarpi TaxID=907779 RepID=A0ABV6JT51_9PROT
MKEAAREPVLSRADVMALSAAVAESPPEQLTRIVAVLDAMPDREAANAVLDVARTRLRTLDPRRRLTLPRLIFLPLDGAIVDARLWRPGESRLPRSILLPLASAILPMLGDDARRFAEALAGLHRDEHPRILQIGEQVWPRAAEALRRVTEPPADWPWGKEHFIPFARFSATVLVQGAAIMRAVHAASGGPPDILVRYALMGVSRSGVEPMLAAMATLLTVSRRPATVCAIAGSLSSRSSVPAQALLVESVERRVAELNYLKMELLPERLEILAAILENISEVMGARAPQWRRRLLGWRHAVEASCRTTYGEYGAAQILEPAQRFRDGSPTDAEVTTLEESALALRRFEMASRLLGSDAACSNARRTLLGDLTDLAVGVAPGARVEIARVVEILAGPELGWDFLEIGPWP